MSYWLSMGMVSRWHTAFAIAHPDEITDFVMSPDMVTKASSFLEIVHDNDPSEEKQLDPHLPHEYVLLSLDAKITICLKQNPI